MNYSVDRIECGVAVCEDDDLNIVNISLSLLPKGVKEGSVLKCVNGKYVLNKQEENIRRQRILSLQNEFFSSE